MFHKKVYYIYSIVLVSFIACNSDKDSNQTSNKSNKNSPTSTISISPCPTLDSIYRLSNVTMQNYTYTGGKAIFGAQKIRLGGKKIRPNSRESHKTKKGIHVHLNLNNKEHFISNQNVFDYHIPNGKHKLFGFIANSYFESIKNTKAIIAKEVVVKNGELTKSVNLPNVDIIYNAPRGLFKRKDSKKILLDFVLYNTEVHEGGNSVRITIDDTNVFLVNTWQAYYIEGAMPGEHTVKLELLDATGKQIAAPATNKFVVTEEQQES